MAAELAAQLEQIRLNANIPPRAANFQSKLNGFANIYSFQIKPNGTIVYRYDVEISDVEKGKSLTSGAGDDGKRGLLKDICYEIVAIVFKETQALGTNGQAQFVYDNRKILFTSHPVQAPNILDIQPDKMSERCRKFLRNSTVRFEIKPCQSSSHQLNLNDVKSSLYPSPREQPDRSLRQFLELLTSQYFITAGTHCVVGAGRLFERNTHSKLNEAIVTHKGVAKGVRIIANGDVKPCPALVLEVKTCAFFGEGNLEEIALAMRRRKNPRNPEQEINFWKEFGKLYKGVSAYLTYAPSRVVVIDSITERCCRDISFEVDGNKMSMKEYFQTKKGTNINVDLPAVRQHNDREALYPLTCLYVLPYQRMPLDKTTVSEDMSKISSRLLTENAVRPDQRFQAITTELTKIGRPDGDCGKFMHQFGVRLKKDQELDIGVRELPTIQFGGNVKSKANDRGSYDIRQFRFIEPATKLGSWLVCHPRMVAENDFGRFINMLLNTAKQRGMQIPNPKFEVMELDQMEQMMEQFANSKIQFVLYVDRKFIKSHDKLKLCERRFGVLTQHVTVENTSKAGAATVGNVLSKMNMKLFGLNFLPIFDQITKAKLDLSKGDLLVIGLDTSSPPPATAFEKFMMKKKGMEDFDSEDPLVVGICANYIKNPMEFRGDFYYQPCKKDRLEPELLNKKVRWIFNQIKKNRVGKPPNTIFILRDGVSEGMVPNTVQNEFDLFVRICKEFAPAWKPNFVFCIIDKRHNKRFFLKGNQPGQVINTVPGSVIDNKVVRVDLHEFFLQAHHPLKGTSKIPQYMFPVNDIKANNDELQAFLLSLCNMWQIVNLAPALPTPVLQAKELAKRGRNDYVEMKRTQPQAIPRVAGEQGAGNMIDFDRLNQMLSYAEQQVQPGLMPLVQTRFNA